MRTPSRRTVLIGGGALAIFAGASCANTASVENEFAAIEAALGGRIGVAARDSASGRTLSWRADERFALCSTFKWALAAFILRDVEAGRLALETPVDISADDLVPYAPIVEKNIRDGAMSIAALCAAAVEVSDNAAANILLRFVGGPAGFTARLAALGDAVTRLDRWEPELNENRPGDPRDTTTPAAMRTLLETMLARGALGESAKEQLAAWMIAASTGRERLRAGLPNSWRVGDKTGTSGNGAFNDVAFAFPPGAAPIFITCYINAPSAAAAAANAAHAQIARRIAAVMA